MVEPTTEELRKACGGLLNLFPKCTCDCCIVARFALSRLDREAEAEKSKALAGIAPAAPEGEKPKP